MVSTVGWIAINFPEKVRQNAKKRIITLMDLKIILGIIMVYFDITRSIKCSRHFENVHVWLTFNVSE